MKKLSSIILFALFTSSILFAQVAINQTDAGGFKQGKWIVKYPSGAIRYQGSFSDNKPVGEWRRFHENGNLKAIMIHSINSDRVAAELFDEEGIRYAKGIYVGTHKDSTWNYFNNRKLVGQESYLNGKKNGHSVTFFENGTTATDSNWTDGFLDGVSASFFPSGNKKNEINYFQGKRNGLIVSYYESGQREIQGQYLNDQPDGAWKFNGEGGELKYTLNYKSGVLLNPEVLDKITESEFKDLDRKKGKLKDPQNFIQNPEEIMQR